MNLSPLLEKFKKFIKRKETSDDFASVNRKRVLDVYRFAMSHGCLCRFPRLQYLLCFNPQKFGPVTRVEASQILIQAACGIDREVEAMLSMNSDRLYECKVCQSTYKTTVAGFEPFEVLYLTLVSDKSTKLGPDVSKPIPLVHTCFAKNFIEKKMDLIFKNVNESPEEFFSYFTRIHTS